MVVGGSGRPEVLMTGSAHDTKRCEEGLRLKYKRWRETIEIEEKLAFWGYHNYLY